MITYVQIGVKDGNDEFRDIVLRDRPDMIILVEPNSEHLETIKKNYIGVKNVFIENVAITAKPEGWVKLYYPRKEDCGKFSLIPMDEWDDLIEIKSRSMTFKELCDKHNVSHIRFLQIDTEGYDSEIIRSIDFDKIKIDFIKYEIWEHGAENFSKYGDKAKEYGAEGIKIVEKILSGMGYKFQRDKHDMIAYVED